MMTNVRLDELDHVFDDHPSLSASLEDFEDSSRPSPLFGVPSQHSGFRSGLRSEGSDAGAGGSVCGGADTDIDSSAGEPWSPPGSRQHHRFLMQPHPQLSPTAKGSAWYRHQPYLHDQKFDLRPTAYSSPARSREVSPLYEDALEEHHPATVDDFADLTIPANIPLPPGNDSPLKGRSASPEPVKRQVKSTAVVVAAEREGANDGFDVDGLHQGGPDTLTNYIRFAVRAEVQHKEPFVAFFNYISSKINRITKSRTLTTFSIIMALLSATILRALFLPPLPLPVPDLIKLSGLARSFEPLIYYSENGVQQIGALQETGVAVWDLGESVRGTNMTSAPIIVRELDELSESLKALSLELTRFFANVDADIDSILIVMEWAKRELEALSSQPANSLPSIVYDNFHNFLSRMGALETSPSAENPLPSPTRLGIVLTALFGNTRSQRTHHTLTRTFHEFLAVLEESINSELTHSTALFALFESIDRQFLNLQRTVVRESDAQERAEGEMLSSLWTKVLGANAAVVRKYEKNKRLLSSVRQRTVANKHLLMDHRGKLLTLKVNLETLRRKLVSPLVRRNDSVDFGLLGAPTTGSSGGAGSIGAGNDASGAVELVVEGQIRGLQGAYEYLKEVREKQKAKLMEMVYGAGSRRSITGSLVEGIAGVGGSGSGSGSGNDAGSSTDGGDGR
ncbi:hypothetical protein AJ80_09899 [Polytolypa hystricis UAMH7299]|uniref:Uncharacterized protein n=1 Tax=Polytolypa hystricis (strain UAMH7299) TaxID=1447883 RepID=A0A2B7WH96_POLH7|nr:hypothetical protein AJ80_09899 [Polytolypa hystricis UAMH7299]